MNDGSRIDWLSARYLDIRKFVSKAGFEKEIDWQETRSFQQVTESDFLREYAWVVLSSGMREAVVRRKFALITRAFHQWESAALIARDADRCASNALRSFGHVKKIEAIVSTSRLVAKWTFEEIKNNISCGGLDYLRTFSYMGPATAAHLGKNLGLDVVKPDRHLLRIALAMGFESPDELCRLISMRTGDRVSTVDLVLWRYATLDSGYLRSIAIGTDAP